MNALNFFLLYECFAMHMMTCQILVLGQNTRGVTHGQIDLTSINKMLFSKLEFFLSVETIFSFKVPHFGAM